MGKYRRGNIFEVLESVLKIAGMIVSAIGIVVKVIDLIDKFKHQKSNPYGCFYHFPNARLTSLR